jgi:hypothetical protein
MHKAVGSIPKNHTCKKKERLRSDMGKAVLTAGWKTTNIDPQLP